MGDGTPRYRHITQLQRHPCPHAAWILVLPMHPTQHGRYGFCISNCCWLKKKAESLLLLWIIGCYDLPDWFLAREWDSSWKFIKVSGDITLLVIPLSWQTTTLYLLAISLMFLNLWVFDSIYRFYPNSDADIPNLCQLNRMIPQTFIFATPTMGQNYSNLSPYPIFFPICPISLDLKP